MAEISISIDSSAARRSFDIAPQRVDTAMRGTIEDSGTYYLATMKRYPAQRTGSKYQRTNTLMRSWSRGSVTVTTGAWRATIGSNGYIAPYNRYVQDRDRQARVHRGRWLTAQDAVEQSESQIQRFADNRFREALAGL